MVVEFAPLEDELGDVLDKAMRCQGLTEPALAARAQVHIERLHDALDYRSELQPAEITRLATALGLNEPGLQALAAGRYPLPQICGLPLCLFPLRMRHGIGVVNAYIVADCSQSRGLLFDAGSDYTLLREVWPKSIKTLDAIFLTHGDTEHIGGLTGLLPAHGPTPVFIPQGMPKPCPHAVPVGEGGEFTLGPFRIRVRSTPGHAEAHNCYLVEASGVSPAAAALLITGDMLFAGSVGGAYSCPESMNTQLARLLSESPANTIVAPGHGPLTTIAHERTFNPFAHPARPSGPA